MSDKVGGTVGEAIEEDEAVKKTSGRQPFDIDAYGKENEGSVDADGKLTLVPTTFKEKKHKPLKREAFANDATFIRWQALSSEQRAEFYIAKAADLRSKADRVEKFGSESEQKAATKLAKAKAQMDKMRAQLLETMDEKELDELIAAM